MQTKLSDDFFAGRLRAITKFKEHMLHDLKTGLNSYYAFRTKV